MESFFRFLFSELARILQTPSLWQALVEFAVPIAAAGTAVWVVVRQIKQLDRHREADRHAVAVEELCELLYAHAALMIKAIDAKINGLTPITELDRFLTNGRLARAQSNLPGESIVLAIWTIQKCEEIKASTLAALRQTGLPTGPDVGVARHVAMDRASSASKLILSWQRGDISTEWFNSQLPD